MYTCTVSGKMPSNILHPTVEHELFPLWICQITGMAADQRGQHESMPTFMLHCSESPQLIYPQSERGSEEQKRSERQSEMSQRCTVMPQPNHFLLASSY